MQVIHYLTADNKDLYQDWLDGLRDLRARIAIQRRVDRLGSGLLVQEDLDPEVLRDIRAATNGSYALGSRRF